MSSGGQTPFSEQLAAHIALPRKLPGREDHNLLRLEGAILTRFKNAVGGLTRHVQPDQSSHVNGLRESLSACAILNIDGTVGQVALLREFQELDARKMLILHLAIQNCAVLVYVDNSISGERRVVFEAFETSATAEKVLASPEALLWDFPGCAVSMSWTAFSDGSFLEALVTFIEQASTERISKFAAVTRKASATIPEIRDTSDPALISGFLMTVLEGNGKAETVPVLRKRVRDSVVFENARKPWRRSAFYLTLRVAVQRYFYMRLGPSLGRMYFKITMCIVLAELLEDVLKRVRPETAHHLRQKLGRRLAKLESDANCSDTTTKLTYSSLMRTLRGSFESTLKSTGAFLRANWQNHLRSNEPMLPPLRLRAYDTEFQLRLRNSGSKLRTMRASNTNVPIDQTASPAALLQAYEESVVTVKPYMQALSLHIATARYLEDVVVPAKHPASVSSAAEIVELGKVIRGCVTKITETAVDYPNQKSEMLLHVLELWILLDKIMVAAYPLLLEYHPGFDADILDPIQLLTAVDMKRAQDVRAYLLTRYRSRSGMTSKTIFDDPADDCFAVQYYDRLDLDDELLDMREEIEEIAAEHFDAKVDEWTLESECHSKLIEQRNETECVYDARPMWDGTTEYKHRTPCAWHQLNTEAKNMRIRLFEHPLPEFEPAAKAALFELLCPEDFAAYRDATWKILSELCYQPAEKFDRVSLIRNYSQLASYANDTECVVTLGSYKKAHLEAHWAVSGFPIRLEDVLRTCGLRPRYCDSLAMTWTDGYGKASFWHHFPLQLPTDSPFQRLGLSYHDWPTSNQIQANQVECPEGLSAHEFAAWQGLLVGTHSRWQDLLRELGSTNINFSSTSTCAAVLRLLLQQGPANAGSDPYTDVHNALLDDTLCAKLLAQVRYRLEAIQRNWREPVQMEILITILLKLVALTPNVVIRETGEDLLDFARQITSTWAVELHLIVTEDPKLFQSAILASLLCKRTLHAKVSSFTPKSLRHFIDASISLQYNLTGAFQSMPHHVRNALIQDILFAYEMREELKHAILTNSQPLVDAIDALWQIPNDHEVSTKHVANTWWMLVEVRSTKYDNTHYLHYNYIYGNLLIDGKEMGTLPLEIRTHRDYCRLFGHRNPTVFPSPLQGMSFTLSETVRNGHRVHFGFRNGSLVIRVFHQGRMLEYAPKEIFGTTEDLLDLPKPLIEDCFHWIDVHNGNMEVRRTDAWAMRPANWWLIWWPSGHYRAIRRPREVNECTLLEPLSDLAQNVTRVFQYFEQPSQIMVHVATHQPGPITADLKRLELIFNINRDGLLQSQRLGAIITSSQDAGTWYGLRSKIVLQSIANHRHKSVLIPLGSINVQKNEHHVVVDIEMESGTYLRYGLNDTLGRVECPPEPKLLYIKALLHAYTSHFIPDRLTYRTGKEEALYLLQTGSYQPWQPLVPTDIATLQVLARLSPQRGYYPKDLKCMETVIWRSELTVHMQDDRYLPAVSKILQRSSHLSKFSPSQQPILPPDMSTSDSHLASRSLTLANVLKSSTKNGRYISRDSRTPELSRANVLSVVSQLLKWQPSTPAEPTLSSLLHDAHFIGGYDKFFRKPLITDQIEADIKAEWGALVSKAMDCNMDDRFALMFLLGSMAFSNDANMALIRKLICFAIIPELRRLDPPKHSGYHHFRDDGAPPTSYLISLIEQAKLPFVETGFRKRSQLIAAQAVHEAGVETSCILLAESIRGQWPVTSINRTKLVYVDPTQVNVAMALAAVEPEWERLTRNNELALYIDKVQQVLWRYAAQLPPPGSQSANTDTTGDIVAASGVVYPVRSKRRDDMPLSDLLQNIITDRGRSAMVLPPSVSAWSHRGALAARPANLPGYPSGPPNVHHARPTFPFTRHLNTSKVSRAQPPEIGKLKAIAAGFKESTSFVQCRYGKELEASIDALERHLMSGNKQVLTEIPRIDSAEVRAAKDHAISVASHIRNSLQATSPESGWLQLVDLWPRTTLVELLSQLRSTLATPFGKGAKEGLVELGVAVTQWQRLLRLHDAQKRRKVQQEQDEWANIGHTNWKAVDFPDWLLIEIDGDHLFREEQVEVALATTSPQSGRNSVLQLLMGKGKTSCILPMVAAMLANGTCLSRIVVPRALLLQSAQVLQAKLGGLVNRDILHIPFSRKTPTDRKLMRLYGNLHTQMKDRCGVILALPEHILSFKLSGIQQMCDGRQEEASIMIPIKNWLDKYARDVLDECDVSLAIKTQLIYPSGTQTTVDGHPMRWQVAQQLLHLVKDHILAVQNRYPLSLEIVKRGVDGFPLIYFLRKDAEDYLLELLVTIICKGQTPSILPCAEYPPEIKSGINAYISNPVVRSETVSMMASFLQDKPNLMRTINLLRGVFVHRLLVATLKKRWNVQYGLHPTRAPVAVPYSAKGVASPAAEWGHPDVAILLTCLSFYYQGVNQAQFKQAFEHLTKTDEPSIEYEKWFPKGFDIPRELEDFTAINAEDTRQLQDLYSQVRSNAFLVDFYLNNFVFPKYAKTFKLKLQASGWNLFPSLSIQDQGCRVTGFSGTNDSRHQLPMLIQQADLPQLAHTNAEVLFYLLQARNSLYVRMAHASSGKRWTELDLLDRLANPPSYGLVNQFAGRIRILIDAGAQILEHSNENFAKAWLVRDTDAVAAVFFDDEHRAWALSRVGHKRTPLLASPFADNLELCVVYLDEAHCRGTDLKLPVDARAALTLGQNLTKDAMVQASMRLRLLGKTQSITFFSPLEVHQGILDRLQAGQTYRPNSGDVLRWVFSQTCDAIEQLEPSFFAQTSQYMQQEQAMLDNPDYLHNGQAREAFLEAVRTKESLSLKQLYEPKRHRGPGRTANEWTGLLQDIAKQLQRRKDHFQDRGTAVHASALEEVEIEQEREAEREVEVEVENVREVQQTAHLTPFKVKDLHEDVEHFAVFGRLVAGSDAYQPMFAVLARTPLGVKHGVNIAMKSKLWITTQFTRTVETYLPTDNYLRAPQWILWSSISQNALLVSPEEANDLIPFLRGRERDGADVNVHLISYSAPVTRRMLHFNHLDYHATPPLPADFKAPVWLTVELGIFSGRLYLEWHEYYELLGYLGLDKNLSVHGAMQAFAKKPLTFLHEWLALRRKGQDFEHTPMGFVTTGKPLTENHPFFRTFADSADPDIRPQIARHISARGEEVVDGDDDGDHDDDEFLPVTEHVDDSEGSSDEDAYVDALEDAE
ncbi:hypothetical protein NX059_011935 [Plenodomus lindquistii]|nr:hypothetical protein NX059_011935 [Plenodomus lindquistii]